MIKTPVSWLILAMLLSPLAAQTEATRKDKPKLIRNDRITEPAEPEVVLPDPEEARRNIQVGDFYFKRGNLKAALERYREAVKYGPTIAEGYDKLVKTQERLEDWEAALETCRLFLNTNPHSDEAKEFQKKADKLLSKVSG